jgi:hypothetical protein
MKGRTCWPVLPIAFVNNQIPGAGAADKIVSVPYGTPHFSAHLSCPTSSR